MSSRRQRDASPPLWAELIRPGDRALALVSGGADSLCLLHSLAAERQRLGIFVEALHVNHLLRPEADGDAAFVAETCASLDVPLTVERIDVRALAAERRLGIEAAGRLARYEAAGRLARQHGCGIVAVGHTADDQAETVLMNVLRGAALDGLAGIRPARPLDDAPDSPMLVRPLIHWTRAQTEGHCEAHGLVPRLDETNEDPAFLRNRIRHELLPLLERDYNPRVRERLVSLAADAARAAAHLDHLAAEALERCRETAIRLRVDRLRLLPAAIRSRVLARFLEGAVPGVEIDHALLLALDRLATEGAAGGAISLPGGDLVARRVPPGGRFLEIVPDATPALPDGAPSPPLELRDRVLWPQPQCAITAEEQPPPDDPVAPAEVAYLDADAIRGALVVRTMRAGERLHPLGAPGSQKLSDFFTNRKLPSAWRPYWPLLCDAERVLWVVGMTIAHEARLTPETRRCLSIHAHFTDPALRTLLSGA